MKLKTFLTLVLLPLAFIGCRRKGVVRIADEVRIATDNTYGSELSGDRPHETPVIRAFAHFNHAKAGVEKISVSDKKSPGERKRDLPEVLRCLDETLPWSHADAAQGRVRLEGIFAEMTAYNVV